MKYLKYFESSKIDESKEQLKDFCEGSLAYLLDDKLSIKMPMSWATNNNQIVHIQIDAIDKKNGVYWNDIKDYFIPFIEKLLSRY